MRINVFPVTLFLIAILALFIYILHNQIGARDGDSYAYLIGAYSIQDGKGYQGLSGEILNHWPPGYSALLSLFPNPVQGALIINYISFGLAGGLIYLLAIKSNWSWQIALSFALAIGFGFFRVLATNAKPDIFTYAFFLLGVLLYNSSSSRLNTLSYLIWSALILIKFVALVFTPAGLLVDWLTTGPLRRKKGYAETIIILLVWLFFLGLVAFFNYSKINTIVPTSFGYTTLQEFIKELRLFIISIPRSFICSWYGSIRNPKILIPFLVSLAVGIWCLTTLRISQKNSRFAKLAAMIMILTFSLYLVRNFSLGVRLTGYGLLALFFAFQPLSETKNRWILYAALSVIMAVSNALNVNSLGGNDPRYKALANELKVRSLPQQLIYTNSFHILDIHARIPSRPVEELDSLKAGTYFLWVNLPKYDAIASTVRPMERPNRGWREILSIDGAALFRRESLQ